MLIPQAPPLSSPPRGEPKNQGPFTRPVKPSAVVKPPKPTNTSVGTPSGPHPASPPSPPPLTPQQQISAWVTAAQLPQQQQIDAEQKAAQAAADAHAASVKGYYEALAGILSNIGNNTRSGYGQAAGADAAFGKGFSDGLQQVQSGLGTQDTNLLGISGAPASQGAELAATTGNTGAADALYGVGGFIPASTLTREGAAFGAAADQLPYSAAGQGAQTLAQIYDALKTQIAGFDTRRSDLAAQVPGLAMQYGSQLQSQQAAQAAAKERVREFGITQLDREQQNLATERLRARALADQEWGLSDRSKQARANYNLAVRRADDAWNLGTARVKQQENMFNARQATDNLKVNLGLSKVRGFYVNSQNEYIPGPDGMPQALPGGAAAGGKQPSATTVARMVQQWHDGTSTSQPQPVPQMGSDGKVVKRNGVVQYERDASGNLIMQTARVPTGGLNFTQAYKRLLAMGIPEARARSYLQSAYQRGEKGRGWLTNEEQAALRKAGRQSSVGFVRINGQQHAYIGQGQLQALQKAGIVPPGEAGTVRGKPIFYIAPSY